MRIYGAGMAGLLAAQMLRRWSPVIYEAQSELPNNHAALLRFRSDVVSRVTGIPFTKVRVLKAVCRENKVANTASLVDNNQYSLKVTGEVMTRSILDLSPVERFIAPVDFINQLARGVKVIYGQSMTAGDLMATGDPIISTIPMPALMSIAGWHDDRRPEFKFKPIWSVVCDIESPITDVYQTIYYPDLDDWLYRASLTGNRLTMEFTHKPSKGIGERIERVLWHFGLRDAKLTQYSFEMKEHRYGKLLPIDDQQRRGFILGMSDQHNLYSLGRFATWRQILLDDVVNDVNVVERFISTRDSYQRSLHYKT